MTQIIGRDRAETVNLDDDSPNSTSFVHVEISDALSERDKVKFTVRSRITPESQPVDVVRQHEEFLWLHGMLEEDAIYAGYLIPPAPPRPNFDASREKLQRLGQVENTMTIEEFNKMKAELESEYLVTFKKTVAMHERFLQRLAKHQVFRDDKTFHVFLTYTEDLEVRGKNKKERLAGLFSSIGKSADGYFLQNTQKDIDEHFERERLFLTKYFDQVKESTSKADKMTRAHKNFADSYINVSAQFIAHGPQEMNNDLEVFLPKFGDFLEKLRKLENRQSSDADLKLSDILRYYQQDSGAAKSLLYRRHRALADYEAANRNLQKARLKNKDVMIAEKTQQSACERFESISERAKPELNDLRKRRVANFKKSFIELGELQFKHSQSVISLLKETVVLLTENGSGRNV